ncbi:hypothetical protein D3C81_2019060 [compost metagenome]
MRNGLAVGFLLPEIVGGLIITLQHRIHGPATAQYERKNPQRNTLFNHHASAFRERQAKLAPSEQAL